MFMQVIRGVDPVGKRKGVAECSVTGLLRFPVVGMACCARCMQVIRLSEWTPSLHGDDPVVGMVLCSVHGVDPVVGMVLCTVHGVDPVVGMGLCSVHGGDPVVGMGLCSVDHATSYA